MRALIAILLLACSGAQAQVILPWEKVSEIWFTPSQVRMYFEGAAQDVAGANYRAGCGLMDTWCAADLTKYGVPKDAKYAFLTGILIITHGENPQTANVTLTFRKPGDTSADCSKYLGQALENRPGGGQRSGMATWVPLVDGKAEYCWRYTLPAEWPLYSAYSFNLSVQAWAR